METFEKRIAHCLELKDDLEKIDDLLSDLYFDIEDYILLLKDFGMPEEVWKLLDKWFRSIPPVGYFTIGRILPELYSIESILKRFSDR